MNTHSIMALVLSAVRSYQIVGRPAHGIILPTWYDNNVDCRNGDGNIFMGIGIKYGIRKNSWKKVGTV